MNLHNFLYLTQLEEYDVNRIKSWLKINPNREVIEIKHHLVWTNKTKFLFFLSRILFFSPFSNHRFPWALPSPAFRLVSQTNYRSPGNS